MAITAFRPLVFSWKKYIDSKFSCCMRSNTRLSISGAFPFPCSWEMIDGLLFKYRLSYHRRTCCFISFLLVLCLCLSCFATSLREQESEESIERNKSNDPTQPGRNRGWSSGCYGDGCLSLTGAACDDDIQGPLSLHRDLRGSLHAIVNIRVWTEAGSHRGRGHI